MQQNPKSATTSRISDGEMARINIEGSAALAAWVDLFRAEQNQRLYFKLVDRAVWYLPMPKRKPQLNFNEFLAWFKIKEAQNVGA